METNTNRIITSGEVFSSGDHVFTVADVIRAAYFRGELDQPWNDFLRRVACQEKADEEGLELDGSILQSMSEVFRYDHELITAEETEQWLEDRGLTVDDFCDHFARYHWGNSPLGTGDEPVVEKMDYLDAPLETRDLFHADLVISGDLDRMVTHTSCRVAGKQNADGTGIDPQSIAAEEKRFFDRSGIDPDTLPDWLNRLETDAAWFSEMVAMEACYRGICSGLLTDECRNRELVMMRLQLTRIEIETMQFESLGAASEALLCIREDGLSMAEVAEEESYPLQRASVFLDKLPEELRQKFLCAMPGEVFGPVPRDDSFELHRVLAKIEPALTESEIKAMVELHILQRHFSELVSKHIRSKMAVNESFDGL